jgi:hypothetical protein
MPTRVQPERGWPFAAPHRPGRTDFCRPTPSWPSDRDAPLGGVLVTVTLANLLDGITHLAAQRWPAVLGPIIFAIAFLAAALWLLIRTKRKAGGSQSTGL